MRQKTPIIVKRTSFPATFRHIPIGDSATYSCAQAGAYGSAYVAVLRLNKAAGYTEFEIETPDNGANYTVTRNPRP